MSEESIQKMLREEIAGLRAELAERTREIATLIRMQEGAGQPPAQERCPPIAEHRLPKLLEQARGAPTDPDGQKTALRSSHLFDGAWYTERNPDVAAAGLDPVEHYVTAGTFECRDPGPGFSTRDYYTANLDVAQSGWSALGHYLAFGRDEGRAGGPAEADAG